MSKEETEKQEEMNTGSATDEEYDKEEAEQIAFEEEDLEQLVIDQQEKIVELEKKFNEAKEANLRKVAELDNMKKRIQRERVQIFESAKANALEEFLPINDDLQRTLTVLEESETDEESGILEGVRMIANKFEEVLKRYNVERIDETGVPFDVDIHDALMRQRPENDDVESDVVLKVLENGYRMGDKTIRHAKVIVSE